METRETLFATCKKKLGEVFRICFCLLLEGFHVSCIVLMVETFFFCKIERFHEFSRVFTQACVGKESNFSFQAVQSSSGFYKRYFLIKASCGVLWNFNL